MSSQDRVKAKFTVSGHPNQFDYGLTFDRIASLLSKDVTYGGYLSANPSSSTVVIIENQTLIRECLARCISADFGCSVVSFSDLQSWVAAASSLRPSLIVLSALGQADSVEHNEAIRELKESQSSVPVIVLSAADDFEHIADNIRRGARGHIPTCMTLPVAIEAMRFVQGGGVFVPAEGLLAAKRPAQEIRLNDDRQITFTRRQTAVLDALRQGKPNKLIAYELNMSESTVKVHVHNIMKKVQARNRTEVAVKAGELSSTTARGRGARVN